MNRPSVGLQINLAPGDLGYVADILRHQLRTFGNQVDEIVLTVDTQQSRAFRSAVDDYAGKLQALRSFLTRICTEYPQARIVEVDYSPESMFDVAQFFTGRAVVPRKACDGSAFYAYLFGMFRTRSDLVFHIDSDMLFGGGSHAWIREARELLEAHPDVFAVFPFPGPPRPDGEASPRRLTSVWNDVSFAQTCVPSDLQHGAYSYNEVTTRAFLFDRRRFASGELKLSLVRPYMRRLLRSLWIKTAACLLLEDCLTVMIHDRQLRCIGFVGEGNGMWTLHPRWRSKDFYNRLSEIVTSVEADRIPDGQRGDFDMNSSMVDLTDVFAELTRWKRFRKEVRLMYFGITDRVARG